MTARNTWKARERQAAAFFGVRRNRCSGSSGRADLDPSDTDHPRLHIECKLRVRHAAVALWDACCKIARKPNKRCTPVLMLAEKNREGHWLVVHERDLIHVAAERLAILSNDELAAFEHVVRGLREDNLKISLESPAEHYADSVSGEETAPVQGSR